MGIYLNRSFIWTLIFALTAILLLGAGFYFFLAREAKVSVAEGLLDQYQMVARAQVGNITTFFEKHGDSLATLAQLKSIETRDKDAIYDLDLFVEQRKDTGIISGVILTDKAGVVEYNSNVSKIRDVGQDVSDRNYFAWAKVAKKGEYYISRPIKSRVGPTKGQMIVAVATPVINNGTFTGALASGVKLQPLIERFFGLMKLSDRTAVYLVNEAGNLIYNQADEVSPDSSIFDFFSKDQTFQDRIKDALAATEEGHFQTDHSLVAYSPISLGVQKWLLIIVLPDADVAEQTKPFYFRQGLIFIVTALTIFLSNILAFRKKQA